MNQAQMLMMRMGVNPMVVMLAHHTVKPGSHTKRGPGRRHCQGKIIKTTTEDTTDVNH